MAYLSRAAASASRAGFASLDCPEMTSSAPLKVSTRCKFTIAPGQSPPPSPPVSP